MFEKLAEDIYVATMCKLAQYDDMMEKTAIEAKTYIKALQNRLGNIRKFNKQINRMEWGEVNKGLTGIMNPENNNIGAFARNRLSKITNGLSEAVRSGKTSKGDAAKTFKNMIKTNIDPRFFDNVASGENTLLQSLGNTSAHALFRGAEKRPGYLKKLIPGIDDKTIEKILAIPERAGDFLNNPGLNRPDLFLY